MDRVAIGTAEPAPVIGQRSGRCFGVTGLWNLVREFRDVSGVRGVCSARSVLTVHIVRAVHAVHPIRDALHVGVVRVSLSTYKGHILRAYHVSRVICDVCRSHGLHRVLIYRGICDLGTVTGARIVRGMHGVHSVHIPHVVCVARPVRRIPGVHCVR